MEERKRTWGDAWREFLTPLDPLSPRELLVVAGMTIAIAATRIYAASKTLWDWDEALFCSALADYDVAQHHPHPPGFPLFIALAKLARVVIDDDFRAIQSVVVLFAMLLFPAVFFFVRELRLGSVTALAAAAVTMFLPPVFVYGGTAHSDIPALTLVIAASTLLIGGCRENRRFIAGALLLALTIAIRPQNLMIAFAPLLLASIATWRRSKRSIVLGATIGALAISIAYGAAAVKTGVTAYRAAIADHSRYVQRVDSFRNPERAPLLELAETYFVTPTRAGVADYILFLLALIAVLTLHRKRSAGLLVALATFVPYQLFSWLMLDPNGHGRLSLGYLVLYPILAMAGLCLVSSRMRHREALVLIIAAAMTVVLAYRGARIVSPLRRTLSPPVAAARWIRENVSRDTTLVVGPSLRAHFDYLLPEYRRVAESDAAPLPARIVTEEAPPGRPSVMFRRDPRHLWKIVRHSNFQVSIREK